MKLLDYLRYLTIAPIKLTFREKCLAVLGCLSAILLTAAITQSYMAEQLPIMVASMGASAVILFAIPSSPMAQPWPFIGGQMLSALIGVYSAFYIDDMVLAAALAVGLSVMVMLSLHCLHPPGAATALAPVLGNFHPGALDNHFLWMPVGVNVVLMLSLALLINRLLGRDYPSRVDNTRVSTIDSNQSRLAAISRADIEQATQVVDHFLDVSADDLCQIFTRLQLISFQRNRGQLTCGEIMVRDIITVEYGTDVESAWLLMHEHKLKALPVLDKTHHVIGIVTRYDFFKNLKLTPYLSFQEKLLAFIKRTPEISTNKPESIGHIMTRKVKTLPTTAHAAEAIPLIVNEGHHHIPMIDEQGHFAGMLFQSRLLAVMFSHDALAAHKFE